MAGLERYTRILRLFDPDHPTRTVAEIAQVLGVPQSTLYRLVREMQDAGFLESTVEARFRLGPYFLEYARRQALTDPLMRAGEGVLEPLAEHVAVPCVTLLARVYGKSVMCVAEYRSRDVTFRTSYEVGRPMPILRGATSRAALCTVPKKKIEGMLADQSTEFVANYLTQLARIRKRGIDEGHGEVDQDLAGIAAAISYKPLGLNASVTVVVEQKVLTARTRARIHSETDAAARNILYLLESGG